MARLPVPGSDNGSWGELLNDFLEQTHTASGGLKSNTVGVSQIQDGVITSPKLAVDSVATAKIQNSAVTGAKIADGTITNAKLASGVGGGDGLRTLLIYYAPPNIINAKFNNDYAAGLLSRYDDVVFGTGLEDPGNAYNASTAAIIQKIADLSDTVVWGYIDAGVTTGNLSLATIQTQIDQWIAMGVGGIFLDVIGYAYEVSRVRQNAIIEYVHSKGVGAILNTFNADEVLSPAVEATYNPAGTPTSANSSDVLLLESLVFNSDAYSSPYYTPFTDIKFRADVATAYRASMGIRLFAANIIQHSGASESDLNEYRGIAEAIARIFRLDGSGVSAAAYASSGVDVGTVTPRFPLLRPNPLRPSAPYSLNGSWTQIEAPDLGIIVDYAPGTHTYVQL